MARITEQESELTARYEIPAGQTVKVTADQATTVEFYNQLLRGKITGHKTGAEQAPLEGVTFGLFDAEATEFTEETAIEVTTTNESGEFSFEAPYGDGTGHLAGLSHHERARHRGGECR